MGNKRQLARHWSTFGNRWGIQGHTEKQDKGLTCYNRRCLVLHRCLFDRHLLRLGNARLLFFRRGGFGSDTGGAPRTSITGNRPGLWLGSLLHRGGFRLGPPALLRGGFGSCSARSRWMWLGPTPTRHRAGIRAFDRPDWRTVFPDGGARAPSGRRSRCGPPSGWRASLAGTPGPGATVALENNNRPWSGPPGPAPRPGSWAAGSRRRGSPTSTLGYTIGASAAPGPGSRPGPSRAPGSGGGAGPRTWPWTPAGCPASPWWTSPGASHPSTGAGPWPPPAFPGRPGGRPAAAVFWRSWWLPFRRGSVPLWGNWQRTFPPFRRLGLPARLWHLLLGCGGTWGRAGAVASSLRERWGQWQWLPLRFWALRARAGKLPTLQRGCGRFPLGTGAVFNFCHFLRGWRRTTTRLRSFNECSIWSGGRPRASCVRFLDTCIFNQISLILQGRLIFWGSAFLFWDDVREFVSMNEGTISSSFLCLHITCSCLWDLFSACRGPHFIFWPVGFTSVASRWGYAHVHDVLFLNINRFRLCCNNRSLFVLFLMTLGHQLWNWFLHDGSDGWWRFAIASSFSSFSFRLWTCGWTAFGRRVWRGFLSLFFIFLSLLFFLLGSFMFFRLCITRFWDAETAINKHIQGDSFIHTQKFLFTWNSILFTLFLQARIVSSSCSCC